MRAQIGDQIVVRGHHVGDAPRDGLILEVQGENGEPPYRVKWSDGHEAVLFPGSDVVIEHHRKKPAATGS